MQQRPATQSDPATPPESSDESCITTSTDSVVARQLSMILERLAIIENRFDRLEEQVGTGIRRTDTTHAATPLRRHAAESRETQAFVSFAESPSGAIAVAINNPPAPSPAPATPKRASRVRPSATPLSPMHQTSPRQARVRASVPRAQPGRSLYHGNSVTQTITDEEVSGGDARSRHSRPLPNHYFGPNPIITPDQLSQTMEHAVEGAYFVVTQGLDPGIYKSWPEVAAIAKNVQGGVWTKADSKSRANQVYREAYDGGFCKRLYN